MLLIKVKQKAICELSNNEIKLEANMKWECLATVALPRSIIRLLNAPLLRQLGLIVEGLVGCLILLVVLAVHQTVLD